jgi:ribosomal-protein-alanine N-acetyltransferase
MITDDHGGKRMNRDIKFPEIETPKLRLRNLTLKDTDFIYKHFSNKKVCEYLLDEETFTSLDEAIELVNSYSNPEEKNFNRWGIVRKEDNNLIGTCGFHCWDKTNNIAEIGYDLWHEYWGQGYMAEALEAAIHSGFQNMKLNRIQAYVALENDRSSALLKKLGFTNEGIIRDKHLFHGSYYDHYCFSILKREWTKVN